MLNLFAYTCTFSVAAVLGGALQTTSVDISGRALERGRKNFELNGFDPAEHRWVASDVERFLLRTLRRNEVYDVIILDPPSFGTAGKKATFSIQRDYPRVAEQAIRCLSPGGRLLAVTNHRKTTPSRLRRLLKQAAERAQREVRQLKELASGLDCPDASDGPYPSKSVLLTVV